MIGSALFAGSRGIIPLAGESGEGGALSGRRRLLLLLVFLLMLLPSLAQARGWSTSEQGGVRWLVTPEGAKFFSLGVNNTSGSVNDEKAQKAQAYYWERFYPNLEAWGQDTQARLTAWGFNTAGG